MSLQEIVILLVSTRLLPSVQHEEPGAGAALPRVQGHRQAARGAAMPSQRVPHVRL